MKKTISLILSILMILSSFSIITTISAKKIDKSKINVTSTKDISKVGSPFDESTGTLTISGNGEMENYFLFNDDDYSGFTNAPWSEYSNLIKKIVIKDGVTSIGKYAFYNCSNLTSITIPDSITSIGNDAFEGCSSLTSITIPDGVTSISSRAFYGCSSLKSITIPDGVTSIYGGAFSGCSSLASIIIPDGIKSIDGGVFYDCSNLTSITIPDGVTSIGENAFNGCSSLTSITIPDGVTSIGDYAFKDCSSLTSITILDGVTSIGDYAFDGTAYYNDKGNWDNEVLYINNYLIKAYGMRNCSIKDGTKIIADSAFEWRKSLASVTIPDSVTSIGNNAFGYCESLTSITIPNSVTSIGSSAFRGCSSLTSITIPDSVTSIGEYAFYGCSSLTSITIPDSITLICYDTFNDTGYYNDENNWVDGLLYISNCLIDTKKDIENCVIKDDTKIIANAAFYDCSSLMSITIPDSVTSIGWDAFHGCSNLKNVYYIGTEEQWKSIKIEEDNDELLNANITYNYVPTEPTTSTTESTTVNTTPSTVPTTTQPTTTKPTVKKVVKVSLSKKSVVLVKGRSTTVKATVTPTNATNKKLKWTTSNSKVAVVNSQGKIIAKGRCNATIKVMALDGSNKYATVKVTVKQPVTSVKLNRNSAILKAKGKAKQKTVTLKATAYPKNANNKAVSWKSSNTKIATVNSKGKVTAKKKGTCYITATAKDGSKKSAKCKIVVK